MRGEPNLSEALSDSIVILIMRRDRLDPGEVRNWLLDTAGRMNARHPILRDAMPRPRVISAIHTRTVE